MFCGGGLCWLVFVWYLRDWRWRRGRRERLRELSSEQDGDDSVLILLIFHNNGKGFIVPKTKAVERKEICRLDYNAFVLFAIVPIHHCIYSVKDAVISSLIVE